MDITPSVIIATGGFHYFNVTSVDNITRLTVTAFSGEKPPGLGQRSERNYYKWEYNNCSWRDLSGYESKHIDSSRCEKHGNTFSFYISFSKKARPGSWTIKITTDDKSRSYVLKNIMVVNIGFFLSTLTGLFKTPSAFRSIFCKSKKMMTYNVEEHLGGNNGVGPVDKLVLGTGLRDMGGGVKKPVFMGYKKSFYVFAVLLITVVLFFVFFSPFITGLNGRGKEEVNITIINVQSFPVVGGKWVVKFNTVGRADLVITPVNGTEWSDVNESFDLKFLGVNDGSQLLEYKWVGGSVVIENYSSDLIGFETSKVLTPGGHALRFQFGDSVGYAYNDAGDWWDGNWTHRKLVTINSSQVVSSLVNFPVLVKITDVDLRDKAQVDGDDIVFVLYEDNTTKLNHEIEFFNVTTGELTAWVNVTAVSGIKDTRMWMYYNNSNCGSQQNPSGVWDSNYVAVYHLTELSGRYRDSTSNGQNSTVENPGSRDNMGVVGKAPFFNTTSEYVNLPDTINDGEFTVELWFNPLWDGDDNSDHAFLDLTNSPLYFFLAKKNNNNLQFYFESANDADVQINYDVSSAVSQGNWYYMTGTGRFSSSGPHLMYLDGEQVGSSTVTLNQKGALSNSIRLGSPGDTYAVPQGPANAYVDEGKLSP